MTGWKLDSLMKAHAIGLTQGCFQRLLKTPLLSEELQLNEATQEGAEPRWVTSENLKKNRCMVSLNKAILNTYHQNNTLK